jgi:hypothetical protein
MNLIVDSYLENIATKLVQPQNIPYFPGLYYGKTGLAVFFCHYASYTQNDSYNDIAYDLIEKTHEQLYNNNVINYAYGLCGIGAGIEYLVQHGYWEVNTDMILLNIDMSVAHYLTHFATLSSLNQVTGIGKYLAFRIKTTKRKPEIKENIERVVNLLEMQLMRTPICRLDMLNLLHALRNVSSKASVLYDHYINLFDIQPVKESPLELLHFLYKTKEENKHLNIIDSINCLISDKHLNLNNIEYIMWTSFFENNITNEHLLSFISQFETIQNVGLMNGLTGVGLTLLTLIDKQNSAWIELL